MATPEYHRWVAAGRPWDLARPIRQLKDWANTNGVPVLGTIGNEDHLQADFPQDHTPFSFTAWPTPLPGYWVCAIDLADRNSLGEAILAGARAGLTPWLKYMNYSGRNFSFADGFSQGARNPDQHIHLSVFSDDLNTSIHPFDPWGVDMPTETEIARAVVAEVVTRPRDGAPVPLGTSVAWAEERGYRSNVALKAIEARLNAIALALDRIVPGVAEACSEAATSVTAAEVAGELEVRAKGS